MAALIACAAWVAWLEASLARTAHATGYLLYALVLFLAAYGVRKKLPGLPLGSSRAWLQAHLVAATVSLGIAYWHVGGRWPDGYLETTLATLYLLTVFSGVLGFYLTRTIPRQLARTSEQHVYERIPRLQRAVQSEARLAVLGAVEQTGATTLAYFYADRVHGFLSRPRSLKYTLQPTGAARQRLFNELQSVDRFLTDNERRAAQSLARLIQRKDDLDFHAARQGVLKGWLFGHLALTWALVLLGAAHGVVALAFRGGPTP